MACAVAKVDSLCNKGVLPFDPNRSRAVPMQKSGSIVIQFKPGR